MTNAEEAELFEFLSRQSKLREWLNVKLAGEMKILVQMVDIEQVRRAQGRAQAFQQVLTLMDSVKK